MTHSVTPFSPPGDHTFSRRRLLRLGTFGLMASLTPNLAWARPRGPARVERALNFYNAHTGESLKTVYWAQGEYFPDALQEVNHLLRDHRSNEITNIDVHLLDLLHAITRIMEIDDTIKVLSAYRSRRTNAMLRRRNAAVAKDSMHIKGQAIDFRIPGRDITLVRRVALALEQGGVGYYPRSQFIHLDTGPVRSWSF